jgi:hypothetical protein
MIEDFSQTNISLDMKIMLVWYQHQCDVLVQSFIGNGFVIIPLHNFEHPSCW